MSPHQRPKASRPGDGRASGRRATTGKRPNARPAAAPAPRNTTDSPKPKQPSKLAALAQFITVRSVVITVVLLMAFAILRPTFQAYLEQQAELNTLRAELVTSQRNVTELNNQLLRWDDPAFVRAQARDRLAFVMPGETAYRVVDPETARAEEQVPDSGTVAPENNVPWPAAIWNASTAIVGDGGAAADDDSDPSDDDATSDDEPADGE